MASRYIYRNAPLNEVIVELQWELVEDQAGNRVDPVFRQFRELFAVGAQKLGFGLHESLLPDEIPLELLSHKVTNRFRKTADEWPLYQIGPGVFTANIVQPYSGWEAFRPIVEDGLKLLLDNYPIKIDLLNLDRMMLRYINVFTAEHGVRSVPEFVRDELGLECTLNEKIFQTAEGGMSNVLHSGRFEFPIYGSKKSVGQIYWGKGESTNKENDNVGLELRVISHDLDLSNGASNILERLDFSRSMINQWFEGLISDRVRANLKREELVNHGS
tara:strand:+ start:193 stop:1011 length:819 start_codon:yes stop_codon:yes gene_type:complete